MSCKEEQPLLEGYFDGELDLVRNVEVEAHLQECGACSAEYQGLQELRSVLGSGSLYLKAPAGLQRRVQDAIRGEAPTVRPSWLSGWWTPLRWASVAASLVLVALVTWNVAPRFSPRSPDETLAREIVDSHVRSLMPNHLIDVPSSDQHTVKPWFNGKVDFSPPVVDLQDQGFHLVGGRLDYLGGKPVAALIYQRRQHLINLFVWPSPEDANSTQASNSQQGYHVIHWVKSKMTYWAVSDLNTKELGDFITALQKQLP
ncbi:MAG: anti-sigma factor [Acidobacteriia bacterium]|nr:anti-sigma factor [Terriglobia bacterium]